VSRRTERLSHQIRRIVAHQIQSRLSDPRIAVMTSVTRVELSADVSFARVYISVMGDETAERLSLQALEHATGRIQTALAGQLTLRQCPRLRFERDESLKKSFELVQLIEREMAALEARSPVDVPPAAQATPAAEEAT
jgi:ribosome-binding factor A